MEVNMNIIRVKNDKVVLIYKVNGNISLDELRVVDEIPTPERIENKLSVLKYTDEQGLYWEYIDKPNPNDMTVAEKAAAYDILMGASE
jgi:hypothetical protein